uniref:helix-turn-helix domain-containing protein n=1 Tax=Lentisalinibacter sediminis TaxID=2992237 RepID=UPI00386A4541
MIGEELGRHNLKLTRKQLGLLERYGWPGNIRELKNVIERAADWHVWGEDGAADLLGLNPSTLKYRMKQLGIEKPGAP